MVHLYIYPLPRQMGQGVGILRLKGNKSNCKGLKKLPDDVAALIAQDGKKMRTFTIPNSKDNPQKW